MPNQPAPDTQHLTISSVPKDLVAKAKAKSAATGVSISEVVRKALEEWVQ